MLVELSGQHFLWRLPLPFNSTACICTENGEAEINIGNGAVLLFNENGISHCE